jgi:ParB family transcriptional regulator, chromosome partitioning protein
VINMVEDAAKRRLGRGLASLIGDVGGDVAASEQVRPPRRLPIANLKPNPRNPRRDFDAAELDDLASSIREKGVVQPILVRPVADAINTFEIIAGERRWRAAQKAGLHEVPVVVREVSDKEALELAIIENVQRSDLNPIEEARGYQQLVDDHGYSAAELAGVIGKSRPHVANTLSLLKLPEPVRAYLSEGRLTAGHGRALINVDDAEALARRIVEDGMSVREAEAMRQSRTVKPRRTPVEKDADTRAIEKDLSDKLGLNVTINHKSDSESGEIRIAYRTLDQFDDVCRRLKWD